MTDPMRCPACGEITLKPLHEPESDDIDIEWECECGCYRTTPNPNYVSMFHRKQAD